MLFLVLLLAICSRQRAAEFRLTLDSLDASRRPTLALSNLADGLYAIESSTNLQDWTTLLSAPASAGELSFTPPEPPSGGTVFYRGVDLNGPAPAEVQFEVDFRTTAVALITQESGGQLSLTNAAGTVCTFTVDPTNVLETVAVTMQLVTNFTAFPYENSLREAVVFQPEGFEFHGAGLLEIHFAQPVPELKVSSFGFDGQGQGFHLTPDVVTNQTVRIPVTHFSGVGTGLWEPTERTTAVTRHINNSRDALSHRVAGILGAERSRQLLGMEPDPTAMEGVVQTMDDYYRDYLEPYFEEAKHDCALARFLITQVLGVERQRALLGVDVEGIGSVLSTATAAEWTCNCLREAIQACEDGQISDKTLILTLLGAERQAQLMGGGNSLETCGLGSLESYLDQFQNQSLPCLPDWFGYLKYSDHGTRTWSCGNGPGETCTATTSTSLNFEADVETATLVEEISFPPFYTLERWELKFVPSATGSFVNDQHHVEPLDCGADYTTTGHTSGTGTGPMIMLMDITVENGEVTYVGISNARSLEVPCTQTITTVMSPCPGSESGSSSQGIFNPTNFLDADGPDYEQIQFSKRTPGVLEGGAAFPTTGVDTVALDVSLSFSVRKR